MPKVSVIITTYNYGKYLKKCIDSVLNQSYDDYEIIVVDDASTDNTREVLKEYDSNSKVRVIRHIENMGLVKSCDHAIRLAGGEYVIRLDADDYFDDNALLVLASHLDKNPDVSLVYPDYFIVSDSGEVIEHVRQPKVREGDMLDLPANGAGHLFRKSCYEEVGGYNKDVSFQDNHDLWIKMINSYRVANVNLPLFYYRKHDLSMSSDMNSRKKLESRRRIKEEFVKKNGNGKSIRVLGIIPARAKFDVVEKLPIFSLGGRHVIDYTIEQARKSRYIDRLVVVTESKEIGDAAKAMDVEVIQRSEQLADSSMPIEDTVRHVLDEMKKDGYEPDAIAILQPSSPFRTHENITEAVNTMLVYGADSVVSVCNDIKFHYQHGRHGMKPLFDKRLLRRQRESLYEENGAIYLTKVGAMEKGLLGKRISHVLMTPQESLRLDSKFNLWIAEKMVEEGLNA